MSCRAWQLVGVLVLTLLPSTVWGNTESRRSAVVHIGIAGADGNAQEVSIEFQERKEPILTVRTPSEESRAFLLRLLKQDSAAAALQQRAGFQLSSKLPKYALWANVSPDQQLALLSYEFSGTGGSDAVSIVRLPSTQLVELRTDGILCDSLWSSDSKTLFILEAVSRLKLTPKALLFALMSHPTWIMTYSVRIVNIETLAQSRIDIPGEFENSSDSIWIE